MRIPNWDTPLHVRAAFLCLWVSLATFKAEARGVTELIAAIDTHSTALAQARTALAESRSEYQSSRALPNPTFGYEHEQVKIDDVTDEESVYSISQPLGFLWSYGASRASAKHAYQAANAEFQEQQREILVRAVTDVLTVQSLRQQAAYADTVLNRTRSVVQAMQLRYEAGDVSAFDLHRLQVELLIMEKERNELLLSQQEAERTFTQITGLSAEWCTDFEVGNPLTVHFSSEDDAAAFALANRPLLKQADATEQAAALRYKAARRNQLPEFGATLGRKTIEPGFDGVVIGAEIELPIFGERRSESGLAKVRSQASQVQSRSIRLQVEREARQAFVHWQHNTGEITGLSEADWPHSLADLERGVVMYLAGELTAVELIDVLRSSAESLAARHSLEQSRIISALELRRVTGLPLEAGQ